MLMMGNLYISTISVVLFRSTPELFLDYYKQLLATFEWRFIVVDLII